MTTPTPSNALVNVLAEWEDKNGTMAAIMPDEWAGLMRPVMNACMIQSPRQIRRELAAAQERAEQNAKDAEFGKILMRYIDRLLDPVPEDPLEKIVRELSAAIDAAREPK